MFGTADAQSLVDHFAEQGDGGLGLALQPVRLGEGRHGFERIRVFRAEVFTTGIKDSGEQGFGIPIAALHGHQMGQHLPAAQGEPVGSTKRVAAQIKRDPGLFLSLWINPEALIGAGDGLADGRLGQRLIVELAADTASRTVKRNAHGEVGIGLHIRFRLIAGVGLGQHVGAQEGIDGGRFLFGAGSPYGGRDADHHGGDQHQQESRSHGEAQPVAAHEFLNAIDA